MTAQQKAPFCNITRSPYGTMFTAKNVHVKIAALCASASNNLRPLCTPILHAILTTADDLRPLCTPILRYSDHTSPPHTILTTPLLHTILTTPFLHIILTTPLLHTLF